MFRRLLPVALVGVLAACGSTTSEPAAAPATSVALTEAPTPAPSDAPATESPATESPAATAPASAAPGTEAPAGVPANVPEALQFTAPLLGGGDIEMATLASRPVLLWFWAPW